MMYWKKAKRTERAIHWEAIPIKGQCVLLSIMNSDGILNQIIE